MRQAITTKHFVPTNRKGARVKASCEAGSITISWDDAMDVRNNHACAAHLLIKKLGWNAKHFFGGSTKDGYVFVDCKGAGVVDVTKEQ